MEPEQFQETFQRLETEVQKVIVGHGDLIRKVLIAFFAGGHVLLEGVPGLGKTLLVKSLSHALGMSFKRIQFTPDLMPSDIVGTEVLTERSAGGYFSSRRGRFSRMWSSPMRSIARHQRPSPPSWKQWKNGK
jgi:MoxR-like ATPase